MGGQMQGQMRDFIHQSTEFIRIQAKERGFSRVVLGLSGGVDSACVAALAALALGGESVSALLMPSLSSNPRHFDDALNLAHSLNLHTKIIRLDPFQEAFFAQEGFDLSYGIRGLDESQKLRLGNFCARLRMSFLYDFSASDRALVLGTSNKSELLLGYGTLFGDLACAINPIGGLYKSEIFALARELNLPESIIAKKPSADLLPGQSDEGDLGYSYAQIDAFLRAFERLDSEISESSADFEADSKADCEVIKARRTHIKAELEKQGFAPSMVAALTRRIWGNAFKRELPLIFRFCEASESVSPKI